MKKHLEWGHLSPNAPDWVKTFPYQNYDPLLLKKIPDFYYIGGADKFDKMNVNINGKNVCLFTIPKFSDTFCGLVLNLKTKSFEEICFKNEF